MKLKTLLLTLLFVMIAAAIAAPVYWLADAEQPSKASGSGNVSEEDDPDLPKGVKIDKGDYLRLRNEQLFLMRGFDTAKQFDTRSPSKRTVADFDVDTRTDLSIYRPAPFGDLPVPSAFVR